MKRCLLMLVLLALVFFAGTTPPAEAQYGACSCSQAERRECIITCGEMPSCWGQPSCSWGVCSCFCFCY